MIIELAVSAMMLLQGPPATRRSHLVFTHDGLNTTKYQACIDALPCVDIVDGTKPTTAPADEYWKLFPAVTPGDHTATVVACSSEVWSDPSNVVTFKFVALPNSPTDLRIEIK